MFGFPPFESGQHAVRTVLHRAHMSVLAPGSDFRAVADHPPAAVYGAYLAGLRADASALRVGSRALRVRSDDICARARAVRAAAARRSADRRVRAARAAADAASRAQ
jgi:hypothetical protein